MTTTSEPTDAELKRFGWAPGGYLIKCYDCGGDGYDYAGEVGSDKRASICRACAVKKFHKYQEVEMAKGPNDKIAMEKAVNTVSLYIAKFVRFIEASSDRYDATDVAKAFAHLKSAVSAAEQKSVLAIKISGGFDLDAGPALIVTHWLEGEVDFRSLPAVAELAPVDSDPNHQQTGGRNVGDKKKFLDQKKKSDDVTEINGVGFLDE